MVLHGEGRTSTPLGQDLVGDDERKRRRERASQAVSKQVERDISTCIVMLLRCALQEHASILVLPLGCDCARIVLVNDGRPKKFNEHCISYRWTMALALEQIESQRAALQ